MKRLLLIAALLLPFAANAACTKVFVNGKTECWDLNAKQGRTPEQEAQRLAAERAENAKYATQRKQYNDMVIKQSNDRAAALQPQMQAQQQQEAIYQQKRAESNAERDARNKQIMDMMSSH